MSHDTHHHDHHSDHGHHNEGERKSKTALRSSFWFVIILVGLFIAAVNFVKVMSHDGGGHDGSAKHEAGVHEGREQGTEVDRGSGDDAHQPESHN